MFDETLSSPDPPVRAVDQTVETGNWCGRAARLYARLEHEVVPLHYVAGGACSCGNVSCRTPGNHPILSLGATGDERQVLAWWQQWPKANVGLRMGYRYPYGLAAVVVHGPAGYETLKALCGDATIDANWIACIRGPVGWGITFFFEYPTHAPPSYSYGGLEVWIFSIISPYP